MSTTTEPPELQTLLQPPPQPPQPHRPSTSCDRHPDEQFTGFCPSCLCERLAVLDSNSAAAAASSSSSSWKPPSITTSTATAALKAIFKPSSAASSYNSKPPPSSSSSSLFPELRRTKSFSASKNEGFSGVLEPQRRSCDVRVRNTLWSLFTQDDERNPNPNPNPNLRKDPANFRPGPPSEIVEAEPPRISSSSLPRISTSSLPPPVVEEEEEDEETAKSDSDAQNDDDDYQNYNVSVEPEAPYLSTARNSNARPIEEIVEEEEEEEDQIVIEPEKFLAERLGVGIPRDEGEDEELKPMKDHIDLDTQAKKRDLKEIAGSFWSAASVFSKKLQKWRQKQKLKKQRREDLGSGVGGSGGRLPVEKPIGRQFRETQSEVADYGFGRRSCDTDPRFSLDVGRVSFDDQPRYSFDEPRASWDGYLMAGRLSSSAFTKMPTMVEDYPVNVISSNINGIVNSNCNNNNVVLRSDGQIPVEEDEGGVPGGSAQTREYYSDSSSRRRKSLDRSNSIRKTAAAVVAEIDELKNVSNSKVSPAVAAADYLQGMKLVDRDLRDLKDLRDLRDSSSMRDDCSESFEMGYRENGSMAGNGERKAGAKKSWRWGRGWSIWGLIHRRNVNKDDDEDRYSKSNGVVERSLSESWQDLRGGSNGDVRGGAFNPKLLRSNSSVSWRNSNGFAGVGSFGGSARKSNVEINGHGRKKRDEFVLERNRSARYSPTNIDNGMLRFYLTPMRGSRRGGWGKGKPNHAHSIARSVLRLY